MTDGSGREEEGVREDGARKGRTSRGARRPSGPEEEPGVVDRADYDPDYDADAPVPCEVCGGVMEYTAACKLVCRNCGYMRDCSDP